MSFSAYRAASTRTGWSFPLRAREEVQELRVGLLDRVWFAAQPRRDRLCALAIALAEQPARVHLEALATTLVAQKRPHFAKIRLEPLLRAVPRIERRIACEDRLAIAKLVSAILKPMRREMSGKLEWLDAPDGLIAFGTSKTLIGEIVYVKPLRDRVNVGFFHGAKLSDPLKLLEGIGKSLRHVKIRRP